MTRPHATLYNVKAALIDLLLYFLPARCNSRALLKAPVLEIVILTQYLIIPAFLFALPKRLAEELLPLAPCGPTNAVPNGHRPGIPV